MLTHEPHQFETIHPRQMKVCNDRRERSEGDRLERILSRANELHLDSGKSGKRDLNSGGALF